jgi:branched-chain amino acid transport system substrate-binding protein
LEGKDQMTEGYRSRRRAGHLALRAVGVALLSGVVLTACSSSGKTSGGSTGSTSSGGTSSASGSTLLVGVVSSDTGPAGNTNQVPTTVKIWQDWINSHGGVAGHRVKVMEQDDKSDPAQSSTIVNGYLAQHVLAIIDDSTVDQTWAKTVASANVPVICAAASGNGFTCNSNADFIPTGNTVIAGVYGQAKAAQVAGAKSLGILYAGEAAAAAQAVPLQKNFAAQVGIKFGYAGSISATAPNYTAQCLAAKDAGVDALFPEEVTTRIAKDCASQGYHPLYVQAQGAVYSEFKNNPLFEGSVGVIGVAPWWDASRLGVKDFQQAFSKYNPDLDAFTTPYTVMETWDALQLFATAAAKVPASASASDVVSGIYSLPAGFTLNGLIPPETLVQGKGHTNPCFFILGIKNKTYSLPYGDNPFCQPGVTPS